MTRRSYASIRSRRYTSRAGFTLVEMMVALTAGAIAITSIYFVSSASSSHFQEQQRVAQSQMSLRMAMEQIRSDVARAAYLGAPSSDAAVTCITGNQSVRGIELIHNDATALLTEASANGVEADTLRLTGNYVTSEEYLVRDFLPSGNQIVLQTAWQGFRRSFGVPYASARFEAAFTVGRVLHIRTFLGNHFFVRITGVNSAVSGPTITFTPSLPVLNTACVSDATVAPLSRIEYRVVAPGSNLADLQNAASPLAGVNGPALIRQEVLFSTGAAIADSERVITEYVADFDVDFIVDTAAAGNPPNLVTVDDAAAETAITNNAENARTAMIRLSVRNAAEDPNFPSATRVPGTPLTRYQLSAAAIGAARVRTAHAEVVLPNFIPGGM
jgi:prepilin-type N-terminal cleavage/methylation domain-containing protein